MTLLKGNSWEIYPDFFIFSISCLYQQESLEGKILKISIGQNEFTTNFLLRQFGGHFENVRILVRHVMLRHRCGRQICFCMLLIRGKHAKRLFINENDKERKTLCCSMMSKIKKVVLQCLNMKGNKLKKSKSCVVK